jgi:hypothetical protein
MQICYISSFYSYRLEQTCHTQQKLQAVPFELEYELLSVEFSKELTSTPKIIKV